MKIRITRADPAPALALRGAVPEPPAQRRRPHLVALLGIFSARLATRVNLDELDVQGSEVFDVPGIVIAKTSL